MAEEGSMLYWCRDCEERLGSEAAILAHRIKEHDVFQVVRNPGTGTLHVRHRKGTFCNQHAGVNWKRGCSKQVGDPEGKMCERCMHMAKCYPGTPPACPEGGTDHDRGG